MQRLVLTAFGRPARAALEALVAGAKGDDPLAPVTVAVPSNYAGLSLRRHGPAFGADRAPGLVNVRFLALNRVAELLGAPFLAEPDRVPLTPEARFEATRVALTEVPGVFAPVAGHPSTARALVRAFSDLRVADDHALERLAAQSERAATVVRCYHRFRELTAHTYDDEDQLRVAAALVAAQGVPADIGGLVLFCPERLTPGGHALVEAFAARTFTAAVLGLTGDPDADAETRHLAAALAPQLGDAFESDPTTPRLGDRVTSAPDPETEVRDVVRVLVDRADAGGSLHDVAVVWRVAEPHARLLHERLGEAGIPVYGPSMQKLGETVTGASLLALIDLVDRDFRRDDVMAFLAGGPIRETVGGPTVSVTRWDRISRDAGVVASIDKWRERLERRRDAIRTSWRGEDTDWLESRLEGVDRLETFMDELARNLDSDANRTWADWCAWATALVGRYIGEPPRSWPEPQIDAHHRVLDRLAALGALESELPIDRTAFKAAVAEELDQNVGHVGRFGEGVLLAPIGSLRGTDFDTVLVVGAAEGRLPPPPRDDPLLPDSERDVTNGQVLPRAVAAERERAGYLAALAGTRSQVMLSWSRTDPVGQHTLLPSRWVVETVRALSSTRVTARELADAKAGAIPHVAIIESFAGSLVQPNAAISVSDLELKTLDVAQLAGADLEVHPIAAANPTLARGFHALRAHAEPRFTEYDGVVGPRPGLLPNPNRPLSPSRIEAWAQCPFKYFLANVLGLRGREVPEEINTIEARTRGSLVHKVLELFLREMPDRTSPDQPWSPEERARARVLTLEQCDAAEADGLTGRPLLWQLERARIVGELMRTLDADERIRATYGLVPIGTEVNFGGEPEAVLPALTVEVGGEQVTFRGQIDRIDASPDPAGAVVIYDYKTGSSKAFRNLAADPVAQGKKLQLSIYALAAEQAFPGRPIHAAYWHTGDPEGDELRGFDLAVAGPRARQVLDTVTGAVTAGIFPAYPGPEDWFHQSFDECVWCDFNRLCSPDRLHTFDAKRDDPVIGQFVELRALKGAE